MLQGMRILGNKTLDAAIRLLLFETDAVRVLPIAASFMVIPSVG